MFQLFPYILVIAPGVAEHRNILLLRCLMDLDRTTSSGSAPAAAPDTQRPSAKSPNINGPGHHLDIPLHKVGIRLRIHLKQELKVLHSQSLSVPDGLSAVRDIDPILSHICT